MEEGGVKFKKINPPKDQHLSNYSEEEVLADMNTKSLFDQEEGFITMEMKTGTDVRTMYYGIKCLKRITSAEIADSVKNMSRVKTKDAMVFDIPAENYCRLNKDYQH